MPPPRLAPEKQEQIRRLAAEGLSKSETARRLNTDISTVRKYWPAAGDLPAGHALLPEPAPEAGGVVLPEPVPLSYEPLQIDTACVAGILCDPHLPYHDKRTILAFVDECKRRGANVIILNGDILDCGEVSHHYRAPDETRLEEEIETGRQFLAWLRAQFPRARIVYKEGNHEFRLPRYLSNNCPALYSLKALQLPSLLDLGQLGIEWLAEKRVIRLGKLPVVHGHEFRGGGGVNPARWLYLRAASTALCGHFHRTSEHHERALDGKVHGVWSVGCACFLAPQYDPNNKWNLGYAIVDVSNDGNFVVTNRRLLRDGSVV